eukprot:TRINITY_DN3_c2_g1_i1.p1 TRINITY_DN3_c2_g1~~TRINITY_DN3_c2_g1_i1.p1  ORF type:complete len:1460 (+),score=470.62 TRINITY_DN3_c2_g1_i1:62-4381(+)
MKDLTTAAGVTDCMFGLQSLLELHPKLREWYDRKSGEDKEAMSLLWVADAQADGADAVRRELAESWERDGLLGSPQQHLLAQWSGPVAQPPPLPAINAPFTDMAGHQRVHSEHMKVREVQLRRERYEMMKAVTKTRQWVAVMRDVPVESRELEGEVVQLDEVRGRGDVFVQERHCSTAFKMEAVEYGLKTIRVGDRVCIVVETGKRVEAPPMMLKQAKPAPKQTRAPREFAISVRPLASRKLTAADIVEFCWQCKTSPQIDSLLKRVLTGTQDWHLMLRVLAKEPSNVGCAPGSTTVWTWEDCVRAIVELGSTAKLQETRYKAVMSRLYLMCVGTPLLPSKYGAGKCLEKGLLLKMTMNIDPVDPRSVHLALSVATFAENLRTHCFGISAKNTARVRWSFYLEITTILDAFMKAYTGLHGGGGLLERLEAKLLHIIEGAHDMRIFPTPVAYLKDPTTAEHCFHPQRLKSCKKKQWHSIREYVGAHFSLLKADCFARTVRSMLHKRGTFEFPEKEVDDLEYCTTMHTDVRCVAECLGDHTAWYALSFKPADGFQPDLGLQAKSIVCIVCDSDSVGESATLWWASIPFHDPTMVEKNVVPVQLLDGDPGRFVQAISSGGHYMFETRLLLMGVKPVLEALALLCKQSEMPFWTTLVRGITSTKDRLPRYVQQCYKRAFETIRDAMLARYTFEPGQRQALEWLSAKSMLLIQGPPGTGKSFIGCRIVEVISEFRIKLRSGELRNAYEPDLDEGDEERKIDPLDNVVKTRGEFIKKVPGRLPSEWAMAEEPESIVPGPVVVLTYKNHALDEFLVDVLDTWKARGWERKLCRLGSRSKEPRLKEYSLHSLVRKSRVTFKPQFKNMRLDMQRLCTEVARLDGGVVTEEELKSILTESQQITTPPAELAAGWKQWLDNELPCKPTGTIDELRHMWSTDVSADVAKPRAPPKQEEEDDGTRKSNFAQIESELNEDEDDLREQEDFAHFRARNNFSRSLLPVSPLWCDDAAEFVDEGGATVKQPPFFGKPDLNNLKAPQRRALAAHWISRLRGELLAEYHRKRSEFENLLALENYNKDEMRLEVLKSSDVIGCTTTGAAYYQSLIRSARPSVLVVEEAAEILEAQILSCFVDSVRQLVLIGDHYQLQPTVDIQEYARRNKFDLSMFERLVEVIRVPNCMLTEQRRMCSRVADLVRPLYCGDVPLTDHSSVASAGPSPRTFKFGSRDVTTLPALVNPVVFWSHTHAEEKSEVGLSVMNKREVEMVRFLVRYFVGPPPQNVRHCSRLNPAKLTVLSPYLGQMKQIRRDLISLGYKGVNVTTVDSFQGDESDIVIVSLTRTQKLTTFMRLRNRMCVACSRARFSMVIVGSTEMLEQVKHWKATVEIIRQQCPEAVGPVLRLEEDGRRLEVSSEGPIPDPSDAFSLADKRPAEDAEEPAAKRRQTEGADMVVG